MISLHAVEVEHFCHRKNTMAKYTDGADICKCCKGGMYKKTSIATGYCDICRTKPEHIQFLGTTTNV